MSGTRAERAALTLAAIFLLGADFATTDFATTDFATTDFATTDKDIYSAGESGIATIQTPLDTPIYLPGCAPFVFERGLDGGWVDVGPPYVCFWEGIAVALAMNESLETPFSAPADSGTYRLRYTYGTNCLPGLPLSQAFCRDASDVRSGEFEVKRELCDSSEFGCQFLPAAPNILCPDGEHFSGPASECTRDSRSGACGYEILFCPAATGELEAAVEILPPQPNEVDEITIRIFGIWSNSCVPGNPSTSIVEQEIQIDTSSFGGVCLLVLTPWSETVEIGQLSVGSYTVIVANSITPAPPVQLGQTVFAVPEPSTVLLQAAAASVLTLLFRWRRQTRGQLR